MINIEGEMKELLDRALADHLPCILGTATRDGQPQISVKGSVFVYDPQTLAYWERSKRTALENINENPRVVIFYRNRDKRINWRFYGTATIHESGPMREEIKKRTVKEELERTGGPDGIGVLVRIERIVDLSGKVMQEK